MTDVAVIGLGYVGLPLSLAFAEGGLSVLGVDSDSAKVESLAQSISYIGHVPSEAVASVIRLGRFRATTDYSQLRDSDAADRHPHPRSDNHRIDRAGDRPPPAAWGSRGP